MATILHRDERTARKAHGCWLCLRTIQPGERYQDEAQVHWGEFHALRFCAGCAVAWDAVWDYANDYDEMDGQRVFDLLAESGRADLMRLAVGMRRQWRAFIGAGLMAAPVVEPGQ